MPIETSHLALAQSAAIPQWLKPYVPSMLNLFFGLLVLAVGWIISKSVNKALLGGLRRAHVEESLARFLASIAQYCVLATAVISALNRVGVQTTSLVALLASAGLAIGLALQGSLSNFASGVMILFFRPFMLGDNVQLSGLQGTVEDIGLFQTALKAVEGETIILPNSAIMSNPIINYSARGMRRATIDVGVAYGTEVPLVLERLQAAVAQVETALPEPKPSFVLSNLGASSLDFRVGVWCRPKEYLATMSDLRQEIYRELNEAGIDIPFPQLVLHGAGEAVKSAA